MAIKFDLKHPVFKLLGLIVFVFLLKYVDWNVYIDLLKHSNPVLLIILIPLLFIQIFLKSLRWERLLKISKTDYSGDRKNLFSYYLAGVYFSVYSPGRIGDLLKYNYLDSKNPYAAFFITLLDRIFDLFFLVIMGAISILMTFKKEFFNFYGIAIILISMPLSLWLVYKYIPLILKKIIPEKKEFDFFSIFNKSNYIAIIETGILSLISILLFYLRVYIGAYALHLDLSYFRVLLVCSSVSLAVLLPTLAGFGARESVVWVYFLRFGLSTASALIFSNLLLLITLIDGFIGFIAFILIPGREKINKDSLEVFDESV